MFAHGDCFINGASPDCNKVVVIEKHQYKVFKGTMDGFTRAAARAPGIVDDRCCCWFRLINLTPRVLRQKITAHLRLLSVGMAGENPEKCLRDESVGIAAYFRNQSLREMFRLA